MQFNGFKSWLPKKFHGGGRDLVYMDLAEYGSQGVDRYFNSPILWSAGISGVFVAAAQALTIHAGISPLAVFSIAAVVNVGANSSFAVRRIKAASAFDDGVAIDTSGNLGMSPELDQMLINMYNFSANLFKRTILLEMAVGIFALTGAAVPLFIHPSPWQVAINTLIGGIMGSMAVDDIAYVSMCRYAARKLERGDWHATFPPANTSKEESNVEVEAAEPASTFTAARKPLPLSL